MEKNVHVFKCFQTFKVLLCTFVHVNQYTVLESKKQLGGRNMPVTRVL